MRGQSLIGNILVLASSLTAIAQTPAQEFLRSAPAPAEYVLTKTREHRIVLLGEAHWTAHEPRFLNELLPRLHESAVTAIGIEMLRITDQARIDALLSATEWNPNAALAVMRTAKWPYREYLEVLHTAWKVNHHGTKLRVLALGPAEGWRETLIPKGQNYETFMADVVTRYLSDPAARILIYAGQNHTFTRYHQPELPRGHRVEAFMDRTGNILWRRFGQDAFVILLHHPWRCSVAGKTSQCLPLRGVIDCAATRPAGFDVHGSPFEQNAIDSNFDYSLGYPALRFIDITDGYIWLRPIRDYQSVALIALDEFAPNPDAIAYVAKHSPFDDESNHSPAQLEDQWRKAAESLSAARQTRGWATKPVCESQE